MAVPGHWQCSSTAGTGSARRASVLLELMYGTASATCGLRRVQVVNHWQAASGMAVTDSDSESARARRDTESGVDTSSNPNPADSDSGSDLARAHRISCHWNQSR